MKVSIVTPSYNQGRFIGRTLSSVASQKVDELEHIVFDAGSSDETLDVLRAAANVRWKSEPDGGQAHAVNKGLAIATGEIIGWLNSDDVYYPGAVQAALDLFAIEPDVDVVYGLADHIDVDDHPYEAYHTESWNPARLREVCFICQPAVFFRRSVIEAHGMLDSSLKYCMDYEFWLRLSRGGARFRYLPRKLAGSRMYADNKTMRAVIPVHCEINDMLRRAEGKVPLSWLCSFGYVSTRRHVDPARSPKWFARESSLWTLLASLYWNKRVDRALMHRLFPAHIAAPPHPRSNS